MELPINQIIQGDCLEMMKSWPDDCIDLVFCSPPYEDARTYGIDFNLKGQDWVDWSKERFIECLRICKGLVAWVIEGKTKRFRWSATPALLMADLHRQGVYLRKPPVFHRIGIPGSGGPDWLRNDYEFIICATSGGKLPWSNNTAMGHKPKWAPGGEMSHRISNGSRINQWGHSHKLITKQGTPRRPKGNRDIQEYIPPAKANPGNVIHCKVGGGLMGNNMAHENEAPFPEKLAEFFIRSFCPPDGVVLDCFCGSGTTCVVSEKYGHKWIGIDVRENQVELSKKRITQQQESMPLFSKESP